MSLEKQCKRQGILGILDIRHIRYAGLDKLRVRCQLGTVGCAKPLRYPQFFGRAHILHCKKEKIHLLCYVIWDLFTVGSLQFCDDSTIASLEANQN